MPCYACDGNNRDDGDGDDDDVTYSSAAILCTVYKYDVRVYKILHII